MGSDTPQPGDDEDTMARLAAMRDAIAISIAAHDGHVAEARTLLTTSQHQDRLLWALARLPSQMAYASGLETSYPEQARMLLQQLPHNVEDVDALIDNPESEED